MHNLLITASHGVSEISACAGWRAASEGGGQRRQGAYLALHPGTLTLVHDDLEEADHRAHNTGALFRPVHNNRTGELDKAVTADGVCKPCAGLLRRARVEIGLHSLRATAATDALDHGIEIAEVQESLAPVRISATSIRDDRRARQKIIRRSRQLINVHGRIWLLN